MTTFNIPVEKPEKPVLLHPWAKIIKPEFSTQIQGVHNSVKNAIYPKPKGRIPSQNRVTYTVVGNRTSKEFLYCVNLVQGMHKYRWKIFDTPVIRACSGTEWSSTILKELQNEYGELAHCLTGQVAVICNGILIGGEQELKELLETKYYIHLLALNYQQESVKQFANFIKSTGRPCAYLHISIDEKPVGSLIFMLYSDVVPRTCENFLRLCRLKRGGYSGTPIHRVVKDGWIQGGGFGLKSVKMDCENFMVPHDKRGVLAMANAGRHLDCSTQFFVLLEPKRCFKFRFVAFGQLIDGEETLKKIEEVETFYEAPTANITIYGAGVVNLDCPDVKINKGCREYIERHIDDLIIIGEMFYEMLIDRVFLEIEFKRNKSLEMEGEYGAEAFGEVVDEHGNYLPDNIHATRRFIKKKEEMDAHADERSHIIDMQERHHKATMSQPIKTTRRKEENDDVNNDFDVESISTYEHEQYSYSQATPSDVIPKATKPYYLAMTDVPYPGEVDSNFDLRRFLKGDYCLEADLGKPGKKVMIHKIWAREEKMKAISEIISSYVSPKMFVESSESIENSEELDSDDEREIQAYLDLYGEKVSFAGTYIKNIGQPYNRMSSFSEKPSNERYTDEELRRLRMAMQDLERREKKKLSIAVEPWETHNQIKRRQTGFIKPNEWAKENVEEEEEEEQSTSSAVRSRTVSVSIQAPSRVSGQIKRRQTGFVKSGDLTKMKIITDEDSDEEEEKRTDQSLDETGARKKAAVRIAPKSMNTEEEIAKSKSRRRSSASEGVQKPRPSVLIRLYDEVAYDDTEATPTLKDYKSMAEKSKKNFYLSDDVHHNPLLRRNENVFQSPMPNKDDDFSDEIPSYQRRRSASQSKKTSDSDQLESIRTIEFARTRPSVTVSQYQLMNLEQKKRRETFTKENAYSLPIQPKSKNSPRNSI